jgi:hypothetical protein
MKGPLFYLIIGFIFNLNSAAICNSENKITDSINDGPYIFNVKHKIKILSIKNNSLMEEYITPENFTEIKNKFNLFCTYQDLSVNHLKRIDYYQSYNMVDSIAVISDIHGKYSTYIKLLKAMGIINNDLHWSFGKGHLVILGDIFDKGDMVTEVLWHVYCLEKQAAEEGGKVHILLGNHEVMVLGETLFYMNEKYKEVEKISGTKYYDLYGVNSVLGNWLRSKPVVISINSIIFTHGGISPELVQRKLSFMEINEIFSNSIIGKEIKEEVENKDHEFTGQNNGQIVNNGSITDITLNKGFPGSNIGVDLAAENNYEELMFLVKDDGPIWYRGYFTDPAFCESDLNSIFDFYNKKYIVVGHTSNEEITPRFSNKIFGVDTGIDRDQDGEMLIYKNGSFFKGYITGTRVKF